MPEEDSLMVIIPTNRTQFLDEAINSVLSQKGVVCQILVVDDGAEPTIKSQFKKRFPMVKFVRHRHNLGLPASRNTGVRNTKMKYLTFLDCDDMLEPNFTKEMIGACRKMKTKVVVCLPHFFFSPGFPAGRKILFFFLNLIRDVALLSSFLLDKKRLSPDGFFLIQSSHVIFETNVLQRFLSDESYLTAANDWKLMAEILSKETVGILPRKLSKYRYHHQSQSQSRNKVVKWRYYDRLLSEIPEVCQKGIFVSLFRFYNYLGHKLS